MLSQKTNIAVVDTPNLLFYHSHRGISQIESNIVAILVLCSGGLQLIMTLTPKIQKEIPEFGNFMEIISNSNKIKLVETKLQDPDEVALSLADELKAPIITNDKFRQDKYKNFKSRSRVIRFDIIGEKLIPRSPYWQAYIGVIKSSMG